MGRRRSRDPGPLPFPLTKGGYRGGDRRGEGRDLGRDLPPQPPLRKGGDELSSPFRGQLAAHATVWRSGAAEARPSLSPGPKPSRGAGPVDDVIRLLSELVAIPSVNPMGRPL